MGHSLAIKRRVPDMYLSLDKLNVCYVAHRWSIKLKSRTRHWWWVPELCTWHPSCAGGWDLEHLHSVQPTQKTLWNPILKEKSWAWWYTFVIPATSGSINRRIMVQIGLGKKQEPISKLTIAKRAESVTQAIECCLASARLWVQTPVPQKA
jgi:hypothetical protein